MSRDSACPSAPAEHRGEFLGAFRLWADSGTLAGPLVVSVVAAATALVPAVLVMGGVGLLAAAAMLRWVPRRRIGGNRLAQPSSETLSAE